MQRLVWGCVVSILSACTFGQLNDDEFHYYTYANIAHSLLILGSSESRIGGGIGLAVGRRDPKLRLLRKIEGELIWEGYYEVTNTKNPSSQYPATSYEQFGVLATTRYRWQFGREMNFFGDVGMGLQFVNHTSNDLRISNNTTPVLGFGMEFTSAHGTSFLVGSRVLHASNAGRTRPNPGENLLEFYIGYRYKH